MKSSEITNESDFMNRRQIIKAAGVLGLASILSGCIEAVDAAKTIEDIQLTSSYPTPEEVTEFKYFSSYTNYYEFSRDKVRSNELAKGWTPQVNTLTLTDEVTGKQTVIDFDMIVAKLGAPEERIYRFRCVEAWGGNFVWNGWSLNKVLKAFGIDTKKRHYISMHSAYEESFDFGPYGECIQTEVADNDLIFLASGAYGQKMPGGNGPNFRVISPQCYGYKSAKAVIEIKHRSDKIIPTWTKLSGREYPFNSVVMPNISHPRWSQKRHRVLGGGLLSKENTLPYNGYSEEFSPIYKGLGIDVENYLV